MLFGRDHKINNSWVFQKEEWTSTNQGTPVRHMIFGTEVKIKKSAVFLKTIRKPHPKALLVFIRLLSLALLQLYSHLGDQPHADGIAFAGEQTGTNTHNF